MFSVIIPYYKNREIIGRAIRSLLNQEYGVFEVLLVDDGSNDDIEDIIKSFHDERIRVFHKDNGGAASARNYGIRQAQNDLICFLDSDDEWLPNHLTVLRKMIKLFPTSDMYVTSHRKIGNTIIESCERLKGFSEEIFRIDNLLKFHYENGSVVHTNSVCLRKSLIQAVGGFNEDAPIGEDNDLWFRCALHTEPILAKTVTTVYYRDYSYLTKTRRHIYDWPFLSQYNGFNSNAEKQHYANLICERYMLSSCKHLLINGEKKECKMILKRLNHPVCSEIRLNHLLVIIAYCLPQFILKGIGKRILDKKNKEY